MTVSFSIAHNISRSKGWGRYKASTTDGPLIQSSTGNEWVSAPHAGDVTEGAEITVTLQTSRRTQRTRHENIDTEAYRLIAADGQCVEVGYWNGLQVVVDGARLA